MTLHDSLGSLRELIFLKINHLSLTTSIEDESKFNINIALMVGDRGLIFYVALGKSKWTSINYLLKVNGNFPFICKWLPWPVVIDTWESKVNASSLVMPYIARTRAELSYSTIVIVHHTGLGTTFPAGGGQGFARFAHCL